MVTTANRCRPHGSSVRRRPTTSLLRPNWEPPSSGCPPAYPPPPPPAGRNELVIRFRSLDGALKAKRPRPRWKAPMIENQQIRWFRTTLLGRTPGWSPPAAAVGPWREVWLARRRDFQVSDLRLR